MEDVFRIVTLCAMFVLYVQSNTATCLAKSTGKLYFGLYYLYRNICGLHSTVGV